MNKLISLVVGRWSLAIIIIIIIASFLRLFNLAGLPPGLYPDEAMNGNNALEALSPQGHFKVFYPENNGREGLFINIQAVFLEFSMLLFGGQTEPWMLKIPSVLFGVLTVLGVYFLAKELFKNYESEKIALLSAFLIATSFWHINFSRIGFRAIMAPFFLTWGVYFLLLALRNIKESTPPKSYILNSIFSGIFYGLGFHSYIAYRATPLLILIILLYYWFRDKNWQTRKKILLSTFYFILFAVIVFAPLGLYFLQNPQDFFGRTTQISVFSSPAPLKNLAENVLKTVGMFNFSGDWNWRHNYAGRPELFWPVGILFVIGILFAIKTLIQNVKISAFGGSAIGVKNKFTFYILFLWLIIAALPVVISNEGLPHALRAILMIPPVFILAGVGGIWLYETISAKIRNKTFLFYFSSFILLILVIEAYTTYFILWGKNPNTPGAFSQNYVLLGKELRDLPKELPKYVVVEAGGTDVRGVPMPTQTTMFLTDTFTPEKQKAKNLYYIFQEDLKKVDQSKSFIVYIK
ncbi:MAG: glycosyltransferase family 39 protein [Patescibacteria group bacterium]